MVFSLLHSPIGHPCSLHPPSFALPSTPATPSRPLLCRTLFLPGLRNLLSSGIGGPCRTITKPAVAPFHASLLENPVVWVGRMCIFYALLKAGLAGSPSNPFVSDLGSGGDDYGFSKWLETLQGRSDDKEAVDRRKLVSKWHPTTKGTLKRSYRVPSKPAGQRLLKAIASLLSDDDNFIDATSHKRILHRCGSGAMTMDLLSNLCIGC